MLISTLHNRKLRVEVYDKNMYMEQHKIRNKNQGGLCEIVGLEEYQVKPYFDIDDKGDDLITILLKSFVKILKIFIMLK